MDVALDDDARRYCARFAAETGVTPRDCVRCENRLAFLVPADDLGRAVGTDGGQIRRLEDALDHEVTVVADDDDPAAFVANALAPAAVRHVTISEVDDRVAYVEVDPRDRGVAVGTDGVRIRLARALAARHVDVDDVQLT